MKARSIGWQTLAAAGAMAAALAGGTPAQAVLITNGALSLGINADASLNDRNAMLPSGRQGVGLHDNRRGSYNGYAGLEATYDGCTCEGWGVASIKAGVSGYANSARGGAINLTGGIVPGATASSLTSVVTVADADGAGYLEVTHQFLPSATEDLYRVNVFIKNLTTATVEDLVYRRLMDWDIEPTPFSEYVTIGGTHSGTGGARSPYLRYSSNNGFADANPLVNGSWIGDEGVVVNQDFEQYGVLDHGALFDFTFGDLAAGGTQAFSIFYGASATTETALASLGKVGAEIYSLAYARDGSSGGGGGEPSLSRVVEGGGGAFATPAEGPGNSVFIFGFDIDNNGSSFENPFLPNGDPSSPGFEFAVPVTPGVPVVIDPDVAIGYDYVADQDILSVRLEDLGDVDGYLFEVLSGGVYTQVGTGKLSPYASALVFADYGFTGVRAFRISDIAVALRVDPTSPVAFKTALLFDVADPTLVNITQTPITTFVAVPEPASWALMMLGFGLTGMAIRRRRVGTLVLA